MGRDVDEGRTLSTPLYKPPTNQEAWAQDLIQLCTVTTNIIWFVVWGFYSQANSKGHFKGATFCSASKHMAAVHPLLSVRSLKNILPALTDLSWCQSYQGSIQSLSKLQQDWLYPGLKEQDRFNIQNLLARTWSHQKTLQGLWVVSRCPCQGDA